MPFFSVIIPVYNKEKYAQAAVKSVLNQTFTDFELIIVNDCSTDNSRKEVSKIISEQIKTIEHLENKGLSASRNTGIKNATGNFIAFLDADDEWKPDFLATIKSLISTFPEAQLFATNYEELYADGIKVIHNQKLSKLGNDFLVDDFFELNLGKPIYFPGSLCVKKTVFDEIGYFDEKITYSEDIDFNIRTNLKFKLAYSTKALVTYTMFSENQITNSSVKNKVFPDLNQYEIYTENKFSLKKYLDFNRYIFARKFKAQNDLERFQKVTSEINFKNLNYKQKLLLRLPNSIVNLIFKTKSLFLKKGFMVSTYD
ncbi:glycosyltransferase family 2 protein [Flavobacterium solisilvae]|uniref:Glycosyltransferase family 2 protein n=1 Tax=Flavobacterium solisilvae TaxID=1852019 RepID=A0ABX1QTM3_9FLAO|nr:glycosyltransferase family A protein [Flavobacterium solisilvae]NMH25211.1 glycosyltransferase family 2 protein [Flavobacterium solisilvae]